MVSQSQNESEIPTGQQRPQTTWGDFNQQTFLIQQALSKMQTATLVRVVACTNAGDLSPVGFVDVVPMVNQVDGQGKPTPHVTIYNVPYLRLQGGANAVIIDPIPGDIGMAVFASRDITKIKSTKAPANPGSMRQYSFADGLYCGGMLNGTPTQYVQFKNGGAGIRIHSPTQIKLDAPAIQMDATTVVINASSSVTMTTPLFTLNGAMVATGDVQAQGTSVHTHVHGGVQTGGSSTGQPT